MYIKNNRLYDNGVSFEIPQNVRINIEPSEGVTFSRDDEPWFVHVQAVPGLLGKKELKEHVDSLCEENNIRSLRVDEKRINQVPMRTVCYEFADSMNDSSGTFFLNLRLETGRWLYCQVDAGVFDCDPSSGKTIEDHPVVSAFINSVRMEPRQDGDQLPI